MQYIANIYSNILPARDTLEKPNHLTWDISPEIKNMKHLSCDSSLLFYLIHSFYKFSNHSQASKTSGQFFRSYSELLSKFGEILFQEYVSEGISHSVFYGDQAYKLSRDKCEENFVSSGSNIVKRLRRRKYDPVIIERKIGLVLGPSTVVYRSFLKIALTSRWGLYDGTCPNLLRWHNALILALLIVSRDSFSRGPELATRRAEHSLFWLMPIYIFDILFLSP